MKTRAIAAFLFALCWLAYRFSPVGMPADSHYSMLLSEEIWRRGSFALEEHFADPARHWGRGQYPFGTNLSFQVYRHADRIYYFFPPGTSLLSVPFVMAANACGISADSPRRGYSVTGEARIERELAALLTAATVVLLFLLARNFLPPSRAVLLALVAAFGTSLWSSASRAMWSHTWGVLLLSLALLAIAGPRAAWTTLQTILFGTLLSWLYFVRPTFAPSIVALAVLALWTRRARFLPLAISGACWFALFVWFALRTSDGFLPPYYRQHSLLNLRGFLEGLAGIVISPSRGLLVFSPVLFVLPVLAFRNRRRLARPVALCAAFAVVATLLLIATFPNWYGGACYGPRLTTDIIPWLVLLAAMAWQSGMEEATPPPLAARVVIAVLIAASFFMHGIGALSWGTCGWLAATGQTSAAMWDWRHPQFAFWQRPP